MGRAGVYLRFNFLSLLGIFLLFAFGGLVRASGAGMGCPDWPQCFGSMIPPTSDAALPDNYKEIFLNKRLEKAERFAALLSKLGFEKKAEEILLYDRLDEAHEFSATKAYTEYINRLWGALTGLFVLGAFIASFRLFRSHRKVFLLTLFGFVAVMLNALLGAVVVHANLLGGIVTAHFLLAFGAMALFLWARFSYAPPDTASMDRSLIPVSLALMTLIVLQILAGTQVRETYDILDQREATFDGITIARLGTGFHVHRTLALVVLLIGFLQIRQIRQRVADTHHPMHVARWQLILIVAQIVFGSLIVMTDLSAISKFFHISIGAAIFTIQFYICRLALQAPRTSIAIENN